MYDNYLRLWHSKIPTLYSSTLLLWRRTLLFDEFEIVITGRGKNKELPDYAVEMLSKHVKNMISDSFGFVNKVRKRKCVLFAKSIQSLRHRWKVIIVFIHNESLKWISRACRMYYRAFVDYSGGFSCAKLNKRDVREYFVWV